MFSEPGIFTATLIFILAVWSIAWKGLALWISSKEDKKKWFVVLLILSTAGILEIVYIFFFSVTGKKYVSDFKKRRADKKISKATPPVAPVAEKPETPVVPVEEKMETQTEEVPETKTSEQ